ncbi:MAG: TonB-dependent hemoglobin/transferrin/lactoferrin family receptor [Methylophaga sp.]|nr:TonB-dependent hemoglobin/transferrin/lactoferrin family receptor [Methylophaga sp.]
MEKFVFTHAVILLFIAQMNIAVAQGEEPVDSLTMSHMVVVANKSPRPIQDVVGSVVSFSADDISNNQAESFDDLLRFQPNINMESASSRFQSSSINIRGIGGDRVAIKIDGISSTDQFDVGSFGNSGKILPEIDLIKYVEILNGPASTLYGSDAIGGVMAIETWDPIDLVSQTGGNDFYKLRLGYEGKSHSQVASGLAAGQDESLGGLVSITYRKGRGINNDDFVDFAQDKLDWNSSSFFAKGTLDLSLEDSLTLTVHVARNETRSENSALLGQGRQFKDSVLINGDDESDMTRISLEYQFSSNMTLFEENVFRLYYFNSETQQDTVEFRTGDKKLDRRFQYDQRLWGLEFNSFSQIGLHNIVTGFELNQTKTEELRNGSETNLLTGAINTTLLGEEFPVRDFPKSKTLKIGLFVQDEMELNSQWTIVPALRFDYYHLSPNKDSIYLEDNPTTDIVSITETAFSPKFGILRHFDNNISVFAQYVRGYRAAPFEDANIALNLSVPVPFPPFVLNNKALPNPDLKSETSDGFEIGIRHGKKGQHMNAALFYTRYKDFIETKAKLGLDPADPTTTLFQSRNLNRAEIYGFEVSHKTDLQYWSDNLSGWSLATKLAVTEGNNLETDEPINSISPAQATINLGWHNSNEKWQLNLVSTLTKAKTDIDETEADFFKTDGYVIFDFLAHYQVTKSTEIRFGVFNLADKKYWRWQDVRNLDPNESFIQAVTRPERNISLSFSQKW